MFTSRVDLGRRLMAVEELPQGALPCYREIHYHGPENTPSYNLNGNTSITTDTINKWMAYFEQSEKDRVPLYSAEEICHVVRTDKRYAVKFMQVKNRSDTPHKCNCTMQVLMRDGCQCGGV